MTLTQEEKDQKAIAKAEAKFARQEALAKKKDFLKKSQRCITLLVADSEFNKESKERN